MGFEQQFENVLELKNRGIVKHVGVSNYDADQVRKALEIGGGPEQGGIISVQNEFSPFYRHDLDVLTICEQAGLAFLPWSPLGGSKKVARLKDDSVGVFGRMAREKGVSVERLVIAMLLHYSPVIIPIPGATRAETITDVLAAGEMVLSSPEMSELVDSFGDQEPVSPELTPKPKFA
jgi:aryl-alcohol dehydrogenase-like predicted oxidoreductase